MFKSKTIAEKSKIDGFLYVPTRMFELRLKYDHKDFHSD